MVFPIFLTLLVFRKSCYFQNGIMRKPQKIFFSHIFGHPIFSPVGCSTIVVFKVSSSAAEKLKGVLDYRLSQQDDIRKHLYFVFRSRRK